MISFSYKIVFEALNVAHIAHDNLSSTYSVAFFPPVVNNAKCILHLSWVLSPPSIPVDSCLFCFYGVAYLNCWSFPGGEVIKKTPANAEDTNLIPGLGRSPGGGNGKPLRYSCLENSMDRGPWWATVHGVIKNWIWISNWARTLSKMLSVLHEPALLLLELYRYHLFLEVLINSFV